MGREGKDCRNYRKARKGAGKGTPKGKRIKFGGVDKLNYRHFL